LQALAMLDGRPNDFANLVGEHLQPDPERSLDPRPSAVDFYNDTYAQYQRAAEKVAELYR